MADNNSYYALLQDAHVRYPNVRVDLLERLLCDRLNWTKTDYILNAQSMVSGEQRQQFLMDVERLVKGEPLQYIVGLEWFYGRCFKVNPNVLIPRPETELLVEKVLEILHCKSNLTKVIDVGTGSGAIGVTIALENQNCSVTLSDISQEALHVAVDNAKTLGATVTTICSDVFDRIDDTFDLIVSNPPYISHDEMGIMDQSVLTFEPHLALFAESNGLAIYEKILKQAQRVLSLDGVIAFEIGYQQADDLKRLAKYYFPNKKCIVYKDYAQLDRMVIIE